MSLRVCITDNDQKVLKFVEEFGSITISQAHKMYYNTQKYGYDIARRRMKKLVINNRLKVARDTNGNENVYYTDRKLSYHDLLVLDYYAELIRCGASIVYFKVRQPWMNGKCISDAYCCYMLGDRIFFDIIEVVRTHGIDKEKYIELYNNGEPQEYNSIIYQELGGKPIDEFPRLIIIDNVTHRKDIKIHDNIKVHQLDFNLTDFIKILV